MIGVYSFLSARLLTTKRKDTPMETQHVDLIALHNEVVAELHERATNPATAAMYRLYLDAIDGGFCGTWETFAAEMRTIATIARIRGKAVR
jgi:hypothetical protein